MMLLRVILFLSLACGLSHAADATANTPEKGATSSAKSQTDASAPAPAVLTDAEMQKITADPRLPGIALSEGISQVTGTAISPLLGVSAVGARAGRHALSI